ncbi:MAG: T9SS type A sorting domain-containing protein [Bacteroidetes bacterium]|nr:T9SS type A sorting domain-containing protein [Bacteroidota bacterium]
MRFAILFGLFLTQQVQAQVPDELLCAEKTRLDARLRNRAANATFYGYDVLHYRCFWRVNPQRNGYLKGSVYSKFVITTTTDSVGMDLRAGMNVDSVLWQGKPISFNRINHSLYCYKPGGWTAGSTDSLTVYYQGNAAVVSGGTGYFTWDRHMTGPILSTLSQPYGAHYWWPCKQTLNDKADSMDLFISTDTATRAASNGILVSDRILNDTTRVFHWKHRYPIAIYLVAIAVSNYKDFTLQARFHNRPDSLPVLNFVFPQTLAEAQRDVPAILPMLRLFDSLFGTYPFMQEKYGHAQFTAGGGMEHQTMSFMVNFSWDLQAHELAHMWFGDKVTCGSWQDLWLNEGFATYLNALCYEYLKPREQWLNRLTSMRNDITGADDGSVFPRDTVAVNKLFSGRLTYNKGAFVLHMLRRKVGEAAFYNALRKYLNQPPREYGFARTRDLRLLMEQESGLKLDTFFQTWYIGEGFPYLQISWLQRGATVTIQARQKPSHFSTPFFGIPLPLLFRGETRDSLFTFIMNKPDETYTIQLPFSADTALWDPEVTVLAKTSLGGINADKQQKQAFLIAPNPVKDALMLYCKNQLPEKVEVFSCTGKKAGEFVPSGNNTGTQFVIPVKLSAGTYVTKVFSAGSVYSLKFIKL